MPKRKVSSNRSKQRKRTTVQQNQSLQASLILKKTSTKDLRKVEYPPSTEVFLCAQPKSQKTEHTVEKAEQERWWLVKTKRKKRKKPFRTLLCWRIKKGSHGWQNMKKRYFGDWTISSSKGDPVKFELFTKADETEHWADSWTLPFLFGTKSSTRHVFPLITAVLSAVKDSVCFGCRGGSRTHCLMIMSHLCNRYTSLRLIWRKVEDSNPYVHFWTTLLSRQGQ